jgi:antitoxin Xre/MbcA/ParS-like protein
METAMSALIPVNTQPPEYQDRPLTDEEAGAVFRAIVNLFRLWDLTDEQAAVLLDMPLSTYRRWKRDGAGRIDRDKATRLSCILGIHKALRLIFVEPSRGYSWITAPNDVFDGRSALEVMLGGSILDLYRVRTYLDAERSGW